MSYTIEVDSWIGDDVKTELDAHGWKVRSYAIDPGSDGTSYITVDASSKLNLVRFLKRKGYEFVIE